MDIDAHMRSVLDLRSDSKNPKYFAGFGVRTNTFTGHTFVIFGRENPDKMVSEIELRGFYPANGIFDGDGVIKDEFKEFILKKYIPNYDWLIFTIEESDYANAKSVLSILESNPNHYNIVESNCVNLVQDILGRIGIKGPSAIGETPYSYLRASLGELSTTGLLYKGESLIKMINDGATTAIYQDTINPDNSVVRMTGFGGFQLGKTKNGQLDGYVLTDMGEGGELLFFYNEGIIDFGKTKVIRKAALEMGGAFVNLETPIVETYPDGSKRTIDKDPTTGNKLHSVFESPSWRCEETYSDDFSYFQICTRSDGATSESDGKIIFEDELIKYVPSSNRCKLSFPNDYTYEGSCEYKDRAIYSKGILKYSNGDTYEGELVNWKYNGWGKYTHTEE